MLLNLALLGPRHTAQEQPFEAVVRYPHHPLVGQRIIIIRRVIYAGLVHFVIEGPDECRVLLPAWMTETFAATLPMVEVPRPSLDALRALCDLLRASSVSLSPSSGTTRTGGGEDGTARTMAATRSSGARQKRNATPAIRFVESLGDHNPAQAPPQRVRRR